MTPPGKRRADAQRNYELLLAAAKDVFAEHGADAPLDDVARRAGIGNATLYRHFPTRQDLIVAVFADEVAELCGRGEALLDEESAGDALFAWLRVFIEHVATKRDLALVLPGDRSALFHDWHEAMHSTASALLVRAQRSGSVDADLDVADLLALANGIALTSAAPEQVERLLQVIRRGTA